MRAATIVGEANERATLELPTVTLLAATSLAIGETIAAMRHSCRGLKFGQAILFTHEDPKLNAIDGIEWRKIERLRTRADYSRFMLRQLTGHIETEHVLCVQWDGFVIRPEAWSDQFLNYDYIGARWPQFSHHSVGNGGFSLRSRRLIETASKIEIEPDEAEDLAICRRFRPTLEKAGIRFAPPEVADAFSYERSAPSGLEFGFHGVFNFIPLFGSRNLSSYLSGLDPDLIGHREWRDLFRQSLGTFDVDLAIQLLRYKSTRKRSA